MYKRFLNIMIIVVGLQSIIIIPSDYVSFDDDREDQEVQGVLVDPEHDESLIDQSDLASDSEDRTTEIAVNTPIWNFKMISDSWFVQTVMGVAVLWLVYKWCYRNDSTK